HFLKDEGRLQLPEAYMFETGTNRWRAFDHWPPADRVERDLFFGEGGKLLWDPPKDTASVFDEFVSDPAHPVPFTEDIDVGMTKAYMTDDQRFAARRPDVLAYQTDVLKE